MNINYYDVTKVKLPKSIISLFEKYNLDVPKLIQYGVEDATLGIYRFENELELDDGCTWCIESNEIKIKPLLTNPNYYIEKRQEEELQRKIAHQKFVDEYQVVDELPLIERLKELGGELDVCSQRQNSGEECGIALKLMINRMMKEEKKVL